MNIGRQIKQFREQEGVNTGDLKRNGCTSVVGRVEKGKVPVSTNTIDRYISIINKIAKEKGSNKKLIFSSKTEYFLAVENR